MSNDILKEALRFSMERELKTILPENELGKYHSFSFEFERKMKSVIRKANIKYVNINKFRIRKSIAAALLITILFSAFMSVEAVRTPVIRLTEKIYTEFSEILFDNEENIEVPRTIEEIYVPSYIPEGYVFEEESQDMKLMHYIVYMNEKDEYIMVDQHTLSVSMSVDTEGITTEEITIKGKDGIIYTKNGLTTIIVNDNRYVYMVSGYAGREEMIKVAESLQIRK